MSEAEILQAFAGFRYATDEREPPDNLRRGQFRAGWGDAADRKQEYTDSTLSRLTWHNVGYRLGQRFGPQPPEEIDGAFNVLAERYGGAAGG
jgi:hypothetical protein